MGPERHVSIRIDPVICSFLADHAVAGDPLLPTAIQLELVAAAARRGISRPAELQLRDVRVEAPVLFPASVTRVLTVEGLPADGEGGEVALRGEDGVRHLSLTLGPIRDGGSVGLDGAFELSSERDVELPGTAELVYPPMFHGPAFQVLGRFGRYRNGLVATPARQLPAWGVSGHGDGRSAQLLELVLQTCGVWELARTGRMMRPSAIDEVQLSPSPPELDTTVRALVWPVPGEGDDPAGDPAFDGLVLGADGQVLIRVRGYRPIELDVPPAPDVAHRLIARIGPAPFGPPPEISTHPTIDEGVGP